MMDLLKLKIASKFMKSFVARLAKKKIYEKYGYNIDILFNDIQLDVIDGEIKFHVDADGKMNKSEFNRLMENLDKE